MILALANGLERDVTVEGIETDDDLGFVMDMKCALGQGFWFKKAVAGADVPRMIETRWHAAAERFRRDFGEALVTRTATDAA